VQQNEQAATGYGYGEHPVQQNEQAATGYGEQPVIREPTGSGAHDHRLFNSESRGETPLQTHLFHGTTLQPQSNTPGDVPTGLHGGEPVSGGSEVGYGPAVHEEPVHVFSQEPSYEHADHAATEDASGHPGHDSGADAGHEVHHI
jgi:hypothetical protein